MPPAARMAWRPGLFVSVELQQDFFQLAAAEAVSRDAAGIAKRAVGLHGVERRLHACRNEQPHGVIAGINPQAGPQSRIVEP